MATVMDVSGLIATLAQTMVNVTGGGYLFIAPSSARWVPSSLAAIPIPTCCSANCKQWRHKSYTSTPFGWLLLIPLAPQAAR
jgi:hypothetical protein